MDKLTTIQTKENLNEVYRMCDPGPGGGYHDYVIVSADGQHILKHIQFQKGPRKDPESHNGVLDCDLLEIVRDRLKCFQDGPYACVENAYALTFVEEALAWMNRRVEDRIKRNVLGTVEK